MSILGPHPPPATPDARFRTPPWQDNHPTKLEIEARLAPDHRARTIDDAVGRLNLAPLRDTYGGTGSPAHPPELLLRAVLYEVRCGHHSPAQWHRHARENEPVRWLLRGSKVARSCWYDFRDRLAPLLPALNQQPLAQALEAGLTTATRGALDGTLVAANASRHKVVTQATLHKRLQQLLAAVAADSPPAVVDSPAPIAKAVDERPGGTAAVVAPAVPEAPPPPVPDTPRQVAAAPAPAAWLAPSMAGRRQQLQRLQQAVLRMQELQANNQKKWASKQKAADGIFVSLSDPEAVVGRDKEKVFRPLYNVQVVDDLDSPLILAYDVFAQQSDAGLLGPMLMQAQGYLHHGLEVVLTDASYAGGRDLAVAEAKGVTLYAPVPGDGAVNPKQIPKREFRWQEQEQTYVCPQGHRLEFEESWRELRVGGRIQVWRYRCPAEHCLACPHQKRCTRTPESGRAVTRQEHEELIEALRRRMESAASKELYRLRGQNVELVNADWKEHRKLRRFSGRGMKRVRAEVGLIVLAHNLVTVQTKQKELPPRIALPVIVTPANNTT
jgi:transposase